MNSAMNTIPSIFNERRIPYTILGKSGADPLSANISAIVLNRGARYYLASVSQNLISAGVSSIVFVESSRSGFELENLSTQFPDVKFLIPAADISIGEMINLGMSEIFSDYVLVIWNDMSLQSSVFSERLIEQLSRDDCVAAAPLLFDAKNNSLPVQIVPSLADTEFSTEQFLCRRDSVKTIYMYDFAAIYNREKFIRLGGFDYTITNPYWQNLDFGFRTYLWGYVTMISNTFKMRYAGTSPTEDISADNSYIRFYLKNLAPDIGKSGAYLPLRIFFSYAKKSGLNPLHAYKQFKAAKDWVHMHKHYFHMTPRKLISEWEPII